MAETPAIRSKRPAKRETERAKRAAAEPRSRPGDRRRVTSAANLPDMAGRNRWRPARLVTDLPGGGSRVQTEDEAWEGARATVRHLQSLGFTQIIIAKLMHPPMDPATLRKHFAADLASGRKQQTARVAATAYQLAISGRDPAMTRFWLRTRAGWRFSATGNYGGGEIIVEAMPGDDRL